MQEETSIIRWLRRYQIKNELGVPLDFYNHLFLFDIYRDQSPKLVCYKAAQIGFSTMAILKSLWLAKSKRLDIIYTMPSSSDMKDFVGGKVNRLIVQNPILLDYVKDKDSIEQKQVGDNIIYYRGTWTEKAAIAVSSDLNIHDEEDRSKQEVIQQYSSRLQHSEKKWEWHFSNPSVEGNGVSRYWIRSDQKHWFIRCSSCLREQFLDWPESIDTTRRCFVCKYCSKELSKKDRRVGRWISKFKNKEYSGYWISLLMAPWITAEEIIRYYETKSAEYFANFVLGLPYVGEGNQVTPDIIYRNCTSDINNQERIVIGCDSGLKKHYVLGNKDGIFYAGIAQDWSEIDSLLLKYERSIAVIDALPDLTEPRRLRERYPGRVFLCHYARDRKTFQLIRWGKDKEAGNVLVDRNRMMQMVIDDLAGKKIPLQGTQDDWREFQSHWDTLYKLTDVDSLGVPTFSWESSNGMDHWCHACFTGETKIATEQGYVNIRDIKIGDRVLTRNGFERVSFSGMIKQNAKIVEAIFENGKTIRATPEHRFWTENEGWKELQYLTMNDILVSIWNNHSTERFINFIKENATLADQKENDYIALFGSIIMDIFRKVFMSIIKITIRLIIISPIWNWLMRSNTSQDTLYEKLIKNLSAKCAELGINQKTREIIVTAPSDVGQNFMRSGIIKWRGNVKSVKNDLPPINFSGLSCVLRCVGLRINDSGLRNIQEQKMNMDVSQVQSPIKYLTNRENVYGITVENSHEYFANDILVSNSLYWRVGMDRFKNDGGKIFTGEPTVFPNASILQPDNTMQVFPKFIYEKQNEDWRNI